jgi:hypothetical protein
MRPQHMLRQGRVPPTGAAAHMHGDTFALVEQLDRARGYAGFDLLPQQSMWHRVVMAINIDVVIERHAADPPFGIYERLRGQGRENIYLYLQAL